MSQELNGTLTNSADLIGNISIGSESGTDNYNDLINKPSINSVTLQGNKTTSDLLIDYNDLLNKPTIINYGSELPMSSTDSNKVTDVINAICELPTVKSVSGEIATFDTDIIDNLIDCKCDINAIQSGSGTPSPSNPRSISGFSTCTISVADSENVVQDTYTVSFGQTVYGGVLDVTNGKLTITHGFVDMGSLNWSYYGTYVGHNLFYSDDLISSIYYSNGYISVCKSDIFEFIPNADGNIMGNYQGRIRTSDGRLYINDDDYSDAPTFTTAMNGVSLVYELATPIEITLTPKQIETIIGVNNVFQDCNGQTEVKYLLTIGKAISE